MKYSQVIYPTPYGWVAESLVLKGCVGQGETMQEAMKELEINEGEWIKKECGIPNESKSVLRRKAIMNERK
jgi:predicted RNase H-like HicB family nuclease